MKKFVNRTHVEGYIFDHNLKQATSQKGVEYIRGTVNVATDEEALNVVPVYFFYVTATYAKSGKPNPNYELLKRIIEENNVYSVNGKEAQKVRIDGSLGANDFVNRDGEMASTFRNEGSFIHFMNAGDVIDYKKSATFSNDVVLFSCVEREDADGNEYAQVSGFTFNFRDDLVPIRFTVRDKGGINYMVGQDISKDNPLCTEVWGSIVNTTIEMEQKVESAFGAPKVNVTRRDFRTWDIVGCNPETYDWDDESYLTKAEFDAMVARREETLAEIRKNDENRRNTRQGGNAFSSAPAAVPAKPATPVDYVQSPSDFVAAPATPIQENFKF